jgi:hypothetical protein
MLLRHLAVGSFVGITGLGLAAGCSSVANDEDVGVTEGAATPAAPANLFEQALTCDRLFKRHEAVRELDLQQGVIRWACADVPGVTDPSFGQEYCEYHAVQNGKLINKATEISPTGGKVSCVFTSVFTGAGQANMLGAAMADPSNLGVPVVTTTSTGTATPDKAIVEMKIGFNSRGAATQLFSDCVRTGTDHSGTSSLDFTKRMRATACYQAFARGGDNAARLKELCKSGNVSDTAWAEAQTLGAKIVEKGDESYERQQDITACMGVRGAGSPWRNSDPMICARVGRTANDCSCRFNPVPNALMGVPFTGWTNDSFPSSCRLAKVANADYPYLAICDLSSEQVDDVALNPLYSRSLVTYCHDKFSQDLVMKLPIRALQKAGTCVTSEGFCSDDMSVPPTPPVTEPPPPVTEPPPGSTGSGTGSRVPPGPTPQ